MKTMKNPLFLALFLLFLGIIFGGLLAGVNALTSPVIEQNKQKELEKQLAAVNVTEPVEITLDSKVDDNIVAVYQGKVNGEEVYVVNTTNKNKYTEISVLVVVKDGAVLDAAISGVPSLSTHGMDIALSSIAVKGATSGDSITAVAGATISSGSIKACIDSAINQVKAIGGNK